MLARSWNTHAFTTSRQRLPSLLGRRTRKAKVAEMRQVGDLTLSNEILFLATSQKNGGANDVFIYTKLKIKMVPRDRIELPTRGFSVLKMCN
jgi:hypothetical protein